MERQAMIASAAGGKCLGWNTPRDAESEMEDGSGVGADGDFPIEGARSGLGRRRMKCGAVTGEDQPFHRKFAFKKLYGNGAVVERDRAEAKGSGKETAERADGELRTEVKHTVDG
jgi:hypothetical protein